MAITLAATLRNNRLDQITSFAGNGAKLRLYTAGYATLLAELVCGSPLAAAAAGGVLTFNAITQDSSADASGTAVIARLYKSDGTTMVIEGLTVGTSGSNINLNSNVISAGQAVSITSATITEGNA